MKLALLPLAALAASASAADVVGDAIVGHAHVHKPSGLRAEHAARHLEGHTGGQGQGGQGLGQGLGGDPGLAATLGCLVGGGADPLDCCAGKTDAICTLLNCVNLETIAIADSCECSQIETSCGAVVFFDAMVPGIASMCGQVTACCSGDEGGDTNEGFNQCMEDGIESGEVNAPDFGSLIPGLPMGPGPVIPEIPDGLGPVLVDPAATTTAATAPAMVVTAPAVEATTAATEAAPAPTPPPSSASVHAAKTLALLAGSALAMAFV